METAAKADTIVFDKTGTLTYAAPTVAAEAKRHGLTREEYHSQVQYVVAHGISSMAEGKKVIIGSSLF